MIVWIAHVKVGHRQTPYKTKPSLGWVLSFLVVEVKLMALLVDETPC